MNSQTITRQIALDWAKDTLSYGESPHIDSWVLLLHVLNISRAQLMAWPDKGLSHQQWQRYQTLVERRRQKEPVAYITGWQDFWTLTLKTHPATLIPRPETELLVEHTLNLPLPTKATCIDLGTGTGAIALALAKEKPAWYILGVDNMPAAVATAKLNAELNQVTNVQFLQNYWLEGITPPWDCIVSNPPYIDAADEHLHQGDVQFEPATALVSDQQGLKDLGIIIATAGAKLNRLGWLVLEHGYSQSKQVRALLRQSHYQKINTYQDLAGHDRVTLGQKRA